MKVLLALALALFSTAALRAGERLILAEDDASDPAYQPAWKSDSTGGSGLRGWTLRTRQPAGGASHAGFYVAATGPGARLRAIAIRQKAFALYANGAAFEAAAAFRAHKRPLAVGATFSFLLEHDGIARKSARDDPAAGAIGLALRTGTAADDIAAYHHGARLEFGCYEGRATYQLYDGETEHDTGIPLTAGGLSISITLVTADTYDLEVTALAGMKTTTLRGRKLAS